MNSTQPWRVDAQVLTHIPGAHAGDDGVETAQVALCEIDWRQQGDFAAELLKRSRDVIAGAHDVADIAG